VNIQKKVWNMQKFKFLLLTYWLDSPGFLKEVARDVVRTVSLCGNLQNMFLTQVPLHTYGTSRTLSVSHPWPYTRDTSAASQTGLANVCCRRLQA